MIDFISFLLLAAVAYLIWRISDQLPDVIFRVSEIQRDVAEIRRNLNDAGADDEPAAATPASSTAAEPAAEPETPAPTSS
jgi:hypothetical protein